MSFMPYLLFGGDCRQAFTRYQEVFGGELHVMAMSDAPDGGDVPPEQADLVMHASLQLGGGLLMGSDDPTGGHEAPRGFSVSWTASDATEADKVFAGLAEGGEITMPLEETFWSPRFGMCVDRFGIPWMVDTETAEEATS